MASVAIFGLPYFSLLFFSPLFHFLCFVGIFESLISTIFIFVV